MNVLKKNGTTVFPPGTGIRMLTISQADEELQLC